MYFKTYDILFWNVEFKGSLEDHKLEDEIKEVDVRCFAIYMAA